MDIVRNIRGAIKHLYSNPKWFFKEVCHMGIPVSDNVIWMWWWKRTIWHKPYLDINSGTFRNWKQIDKHWDDYNMAVVTTNERWYEDRIKVLEKTVEDSEEWLAHFIMDMDFEELYPEKYNADYRLKSVKTWRNSASKLSDRLMKIIKDELYHDLS